MVHDCELIVNYDKTKNLDMVRVPVQVVTVMLKKYLSHLYI